MTEVVEFDETYERWMRELGVDIKTHLYILINKEISKEWDRSGMSHIGYWKVDKNLLTFIEQHQSVKWTFDLHLDNVEKTDLARVGYFNRCGYTVAFYNEGELQQNLQFRLGTVTDDFAYDISIMLINTMKVLLAEYFGNDKFI